MIYLLCICVFGLFVFSALVFKRDCTAPAVLMTLGFVISLLCCCVYANEWNFNDYRLFWVVLSGIAAFVLACWFAFVLFNKRKPQLCSYIYTTVTDEDKITISNTRLVIYLVMQLLVILYWIYNLYKYSYGGTLASAIGYYYSMNRSDSLEYKSRVLNIAGILTMPATYLLLYIWADKLTHKSKTSVLVPINIGIAIISSLLNGTRTTLFMYAIAFAVMYIIQKQRVTCKNANMNLKNIIKFLGVFFFSIIIFFLLFSFQGRTVKDLSMVDLIANYLGAPIKNLEFFLNDNITGTRISAGSATFMNTYMWLNKVFGKNIFNLPDLYKYRWNNGKILGNVYTQFMPLYYDYGIAGVFYVMFILGVFCQHIYNRVKTQHKKRKIDYFLILYSYVSFAIIFCFFSNKFFELIFARAMIYNAVGLILADLFFLKLRLKKHRLIIKIK